MGSSLGRNALPSDSSKPEAYSVDLPSAECLRGQSMYSYSYLEEASSFNVLANRVAKVLGVPNRYDHVENSQML